MMNDKLQSKDSYSLNLQRNIQQLTEKEYDVLIVGCGIYGAAAARDAALRGMSVAIIDSRDFCGATSANSLKIIHGGLRYLQQMDIPRVLESVRERKLLMRTASHLVHPMPCIMPTRGYLLKSRAAMTAGLILNEILSCRRNISMDPQKYVPMGKTVSKSVCLSYVNGLDGRGITGGAIWFDGLAYNTERLVISMVRSAVDAGAVPANYVKMTGFIKTKNQIKGISAVDALTGNKLEIRAKVVINNTGPWANATLDMLDLHTTKPVMGLAMGMNFVLKRKIFSKYSVGLVCPRETSSKERLLFFVPWQNGTMVGTYYRSHEGTPDQLKVKAEDIDLFLADLNKAYPAGKFTNDDIALIHAGVLPTVENTSNIRDPKLSGHYAIIDHHSHDDISGLISVSGVKYTTARDVAKKTIDLALKKLNKSAGNSPTDKAHIAGADIKNFNNLLTDADARNIPRRLIYNYGTDYKKIIDGCENTEDTLDAEIRFVVSHEMPQTLADLIFRRTDFAAHGIPDDTMLRRCSEAMALSLGWDSKRISDEIRRVKSVKFPGSEFCSDN
ncbi:glycerol-3-phosphate dehydrogenase/oxidase [Verrucomicrobiota bacterium]